MFEKAGSQLIDLDGESGKKSKVKMKPIRTDCKVKFEKSFFKGTWKKPKFSHKAIIEGIVTKHSYGSIKGQHTFTIIVSKCSTDDYKENDKMLIKGRNLYPNIIEHIQGRESKATEKKLLELLIMEGKI